MLDKFDMQIRNAELINAVNTSEIVSNVISTFGPRYNEKSRAYARQNFRCTACGKSIEECP